MNKALRPIDCYDIYSDPTMYDIESSFEYDIPLYLELAESFGGPILELGSGTGRVTIPLAKAGHKMTGLDISPPMVKRACDKATEQGVSVEFQVADCRNFSLERSFGLIIMPYNAIMHILDRPSYEALFACVHKHLKPDGRFSFTCFNPHEAWIYRDPDKRYPSYEYDLPDGTPVVITESNVYDKATQINHVKWYIKIGNQEEQVRELNMRQYYPEELEAIIHYNGFELEDRYGGPDKGPFVSSSKHQICVCRPR